MAQSPQLKQSSPTSPDPQDFRLDATPAMRADNVVSGEHWRIGLITDSLVRFEWSDSGVFENRPTQTVLNRDFGSQSNAASPSVTAASSSTPRP